MHLKRFTLYSRIAPAVFAQGHLEDSNSEMFSTLCNIMGTPQAYAAIASNLTVRLTVPPCAQPSAGTAALPKHSAQAARSGLATHHWPHQLSLSAAP